MYASVIIPYYNEKKNVRRVTESVLEVLAKESIHSEIILVDDGSIDDSSEELRALASQKKVKLITHNKNLGKSRALRTGFDIAEGDVILTLDADGQHDPKYIPQFLDELCNGADIVVARRMNRANTKVRNAFSAFYNWFLQVTLKVPYADFNSGYMAFTRECVNAIGFSKQEIDGYNGLHRYLIPLGLFHGFHVTQISIEHLPRMSGRSFIRFETHSLPLVKDHIRFMRQHYSELEEYANSLPPA